MEIKKIGHRNIGLLEPLAVEAKKEGINFVQRTIDEWISGANCFSKPGEILWGAFDDNRCVGIGGLNIDPYAGDPKVGRVRHLYIMLGYRNRGIASDLLARIIERAAGFFEVLRVSTHKPGTANPEADKFYEFMGFAKAGGEKQTHIMKIKKALTKKND